MPTYLNEARELAGNDHLRITSVSANLTLPIGFIGPDTIFHTHWFDNAPGEGVVGYNTTDGQRWNTVTPISGCTLAMWTDPQGYKHSFLLNVWPRANSVKIVSRFETYQRIWLIMAQTGASYHLVRQVIFSAGIADAEHSIRLVEWLRHPPQAARTSLADLLDLLRREKLDQVRTHLLGTKWERLADSQLVNTLLGARQYARALGM